ncbi:MAG: hypothetical protein IPP82_16980 [Xanthomonadales bacterium]|nr:hypothetical protein [Xanthomonadales bacterium]
MRVAQRAPCVADAIEDDRMSRCDQLGGLQHDQGRARIVAGEQGAAEIARGFDRSRIDRMRGFEHADCRSDPVHAQQGETVQPGRFDRRRKPRARLRREICGKIGATLADQGGDVVELLVHGRSALRR